MGICILLTPFPGVIPVRVGTISKFIGIMVLSTFTLTVTGPPLNGVNVAFGENIFVNVPDGGFMVPDVAGETVKETGIPSVGILSNCGVPSE